MLESKGPWSAQGKRLSARRRATLPRPASADRNRLGRLLGEVPWLHEPDLIRVSRRLRAVAEGELGEDALDVRLYRPFADHEGFRDFRVGVSPGDQPEDLLLATCERCEPGQFHCRARFRKD